MRTSENTLRRGALTILCTLALLIVCGGLVPMAVQAEEYEEPEFYVCFSYDDSLPYEVYDEDTDEYRYEYTLDLDEAGLGSGTATLDGHTLTLDNVTLEGEGSISCYSTSNDPVDLTIVLQGLNKIALSDNGYAISCQGNLTIQGEGSLDIQVNGAGYGIDVQDTLTIENHANVKIEGQVGEDDYNSFIGMSASNIVIQDSDVEINGDYGICATGDDQAISIMDSTVQVKATAAPFYDDGRYYAAIGAYEAIMANSIDDTYRAKQITISGKSTVIADGGFYANLELTPPADGVTRVAVSAQPGGSAAEISGDDYPFTAAQNIAYSDDLLKNGYIKIWAATESGEELTATASSTSSAAKAKVEDTEAPCDHRYDWEVYKAATATTDGIMRYRCVNCGDVEYEVPTAAYYIFNKNAQESIQKAAPNATVKVETPIFISFHKMVKDALVARPDVTLVVDYKNQGKNYEMTIPAGSADQLETLFGDETFAGFLYLGGAFTTVEK